MLHFFGLNVNNIFMFTINHLFISIITMKTHEANLIRFIVQAMQTCYHSPNFFSSFIFWISLI